MPMFSGGNTGSGSGNSYARAVPPPYEETDDTSSTHFV